MREVREEFAKDQTTGVQLDPTVNALKWMWEQQCSYTEEQLNFWPLLRPLTDSSEVLSQHLVHWLLSVWHWASVVDPLTYLPTPPSLNIGHCVRKDCKVSERQKWIVTYVCALQHVGKASVGCSWTMEDKSMTPKVSKLVETFIATTGTCIPLCMVRECWPSLKEDTPQ